MTDDMTPPDWFVDEFRSAFIDLTRDVDDGHDGTSHRARQLWHAVAAHRPQPSTVVDVPTHPYEPATEHATPRLGMPEPAVPTNPRRVYAMVPGRDTDGNASMSPLYVTREAEARVAPRVDCPDCGGNGDIVVYEDLDGGGTGNGAERMCTTCLGTGLVAGPPTEPRDTGIVPADHPFMVPPSDDDAAARDALPVDPGTAAAIAAVRARTDAMTDRP